MGRGGQFCASYFLVASVFALCLSAAAQTTYTVTDLGTLGGNISDPSGINNSGQVTGNSTTSGDTFIHAFLYSGGTMVDLGTLGGSTSSGSSINNSGQVTGGSTTSGDTFIHAFLYSGGTMVDLGTLGGSSSGGAGINDSGQITGFSSTTGDFFPERAFLYSGGTMNDLGTLGGSSSGGAGINDSGQITGFSDTTGDTTEHAFLYTEGTMTDLGTLGGNNSEGRGINALGQITGGSSTTGNTAEHVFLYSAGTMTDLGTSSGNFSEGLGINSLGQVVGFFTKTNESFAFLYTPGVGLVDLNTLLLEGSGWGSLIFASAINDVGQITGIGINPGGQRHAFLLNPVTIPFSAFEARLGLGRGNPPTRFRLKGNFTLGAGSSGIDLAAQAITLQLGTLSVLIPPGSFTQAQKGDYVFQGTIGTVALQFRLSPLTSTSFSWQADGITAPLSLTNPVAVRLTIGNNTGTVSVTSHGA